jgi:hypothetical protein
MSVSSNHNNDYLHRACPVCASLKTQGKETSSPLPANKLKFTELMQYWNGFFKQKVIFSYARCEGCGLLYCPTFFNEAQLEKLYGQMPANMDDVPLAELNNTQYGYFKALKKSSPLEGGFIEIGPDIGLFTQHCVREGSFHKYWLFEPNREVKAVLEGVVKGRSAQVIHEMFNFSAVPDVSASAAVIIHVMDHLIDPVAILSELRKKLTADARLLIVTHDESSLLRRIFGWKWPAFCLQHPQIYNLKTTKSLLHKAGFDVLEQHKTVNYFKLSFLVKHLLWALGLKVRTVPSFCDVTVGLKLGNILTIATPKTGVNDGH